ncbi:MAG: low molecular weight phosphotyrosine protein phosphatase [Chloroflexota bacterium]
MPSVLFVCTGNQFRSPVAAEAFRQRLARDGRAAQWTVNSAGTWTTPGQPPLRLALDAARVLGMDLSRHSTRLVDEDLLKESDLVLVMESGHKEALLVEFPSARGKVFLLSEALEGIAYDIPDPAWSPEETEGILRDVAEMVRKGSGKIYEMAEAG